MSHIVDIDTAFNDLDAVEKAFAKVGGKLVRGATTYRWVGHWFDDSPVPRSIFASEDEYRKVCGMRKDDRKSYMEDILGKCKHKITFADTQYEVGLVEVDGNLKLVWDWATPLAEKLGSTDDWGRNNTEKLAPILYDYVRYSFENQLGENFYCTMDEVNEEGLLNLEYTLR